MTIINIYELNSLDHTHALIKIPWHNINRKQKREIGRRRNAISAYKAQLSPAGLLPPSYE
jgi:hypothetical protein